MSDTTNFAGLRTLEPGEPLDVEFLRRNPEVIDALLRVGAVTHRHDGHAALANPVALPVASIDATGGTIPADLSIYLAYTYVDADGGETLLSDPALVSTLPGLDAPLDAPTAAVDHTAGGLLADTYTYGVTLSDGLGGETTLGGTVQVTVDPGFANSQVVISGLAAILADADAAEWRLYRARGTGNFVYLTSGSGDSVTDDDTLCPHCDESPPTASTTANTNLLRVTLPDDWPTGVTSLRLYASVGGSFDGDCLLGAYLPADQGAEKTYAALTLLPGAPPPVNRSVPGAGMIDPDTEVLGVFKRPVASAAALPAAGNTDGDIRETLDDHALHVWTGAEWVDLGGGGGGSTSVPIDTTGFDGRVPIWTKDGVPVLWLRGHEQPVSGVVMTEGFDQPAGPVGDDYASDGGSNAIPEASGNDTNAIHYPTLARMFDGYVERTFTVQSLNWTRSGVTLGDNRIGLFAWITLMGNLEIATRTVDSNGEADFTIIATDALDPPPSTFETYNVRLERTGNHLHATAFTGKALIGDVEIDIPAPLQPDFGSGVSLRPGLADRWTDPDAWTTEIVEAVGSSQLHEVWIDGTGQNGSTVRYRLFDGVGDSYTSLNYDTADWADDGAIPTTTLRDATHYVTLAGKAVKSSGVAPVTGDVIGYLDAEAVPVNGDILVPVATGDDDGVQLGMVSISMAGEVAWLDGKSTDPATKHPYVSFDGISYPT